MQPKNLLFWNMSLVQDLENLCADRIQVRTVKG